MGAILINVGAFCSGAILLCFHKKKIMRDPIERDYIIIAFIRQLT
jgi:hypothetical protein